MARTIMALVGLFSASALAAPEPGQTFPSFEARDVLGEPTTFEALHEERPTLVVAITDRHAADDMQAWFDAAERERLEVNRVSIVSVRVGGFVSPKTARERARKMVPEQWRSKTLFDSNRRIGNLLDLGGDPDVPWVFALDAEGRVLARVKGPLSDERAREIFDAFE